jgi:hypothetical protein
VRAAVFSPPITGEGFKVNVEKKRSGVIRSDRQAAGLIVTGMSAEGPINFELCYREFDYLLASVLQNTWAVYGHRGVGAVFNGTFSAGNILTAGAATVGASDFTKLKLGQWVQLQRLGHRREQHPRAALEDGRRRPRRSSRSRRRASSRTARAARLARSPRRA